MRITRVYTRGGDQGESGLAGGQRVPKHDPRLDAYGTVDELSASIGWAREVLRTEKEQLMKEDFEYLDQLLEYFGNQLFTLGGDLATRLEDRVPQMPVIREDDIQFLEQVCDRYNAQLPPLEDFILPGERKVSALAEKEEVGDLPLKYLNRLSDTLFVLARWTNRRLGGEDITWRRDLPKPPLPSDSLNDERR